MAQQAAITLKTLREAFLKADRDKDKLLNREEFKEFVEIGYRKSCPEGMYDNLCNHFSRDPSIGIDWSTAKEVYLQSTTQTQRAKSARPPAPSPSPQPPSAAVSKHKKIKQVFIQCDKDADQYLNRKEFEEFVRVGFKKSEVPHGMYDHVCSHFKKDPDVGMDWLSIYTLWKQSNPDSNTATSPRSRQQNNSQAEELDNGTRGMAEDEESIGSTSSQIRRQGTHRRLRSRDRQGSRDIGFDDGPDASQMMMQMLESKVKNYSQQLKLEVRKRKKTEELAQSLLTQNETYKQQIDEFQSTITRFNSDSKQLKERIRKLQSIVDDDRATIKHLKQQCKTMKSDRDETFALLSKIEKQHASMVKKEKSKHKNEMEKLSAGFLQSLGADPGTDVAAVVKELRTNNVKLQQQVDQMAETLARKNQSLIEALQAVDSIAMEDEKHQSELQNFREEQKMALSPRASHRRNPSSGLRDKVKAFHQRRKSLRHSSQQSMSDESALSGLPKPPKRRNSQLGLHTPNSKPHHRPTATFFKDAMSDSNATHGGPLPHPHHRPHHQPPRPPQLTIANAKNGKELQFVSQQLTNDVVQKSESIENLQFSHYIR